METIDYGIDAPKDQQNMMWRGLTFLALGFGIYFMNRRDYPGPAGSMLAVLGLVGLGFLALSGAWYWSSKNGKLKLRDQILEAVSLKGDEKVLDIGCGRGLLLIGAAKKLSGKGKAFGIDSWRAEDLSSNSDEATLANAKAAGVADKVRIETADATALPYPDGNFDVVVSSLVIHNIPTPEGRAKAVSEAYRVTKTGGKIALYDLFSAGEYAARLKELGAGDVGVSSVPCGVFPGKLVQAKKV